MVDYEIFKSRFKEIAEFTLAKPDEEIDLGAYKCGSSGCIAGKLPELEPTKFRWIEPNDIGDAVPCSKKYSYEGYDLIFELAEFTGEDFYVATLTALHSSLTSLFEVNEHELTDREIIKNRLKVVETADSYYEFISFMVNQEGYV